MSKYSLTITAEDDKELKSILTRLGLAAPTTSTAETVDEPTEPVRRTPKAKAPKEEPAEEPAEETKEEPAEDDADAKRAELKKQLGKLTELTDRPTAIKLLKKFGPSTAEVEEDELDAAIAAVKKAIKTASA